MQKTEILKEAIALRKSITFEYNKEGKMKGGRIGNPHAVFVATKKNGEYDTKVHIVQTGGVSDSETNKFPEFRLFNVDEISNIEIIHNNPQFTVDERYNSEWDGYKDFIVKI